MKRLTRVLIVVLAVGGAWMGVKAVTDAHAVRAARQTACAQQVGRGSAPSALVRHLADSCIARDYLIGTAP